MTVTARPPGESLPLRPAPAPLPPRTLPRLPDAGLLWSRAVRIGAFLFACFLLDQLANLLMQKWLLDSLGYGAIFTTNLHAGAIIFAACFVAFGAAVALPALFAAGLGRSGKRLALLLAAMVGAYAGYVYQSRFGTYLLAFHAQDFDVRDPVYDHDVGFYVFKLPAILTTAHIVTVLALVGTVAAAVSSYLGRRTLPRPPGMSRPVAAVARMTTPFTLFFFVLLGLALATDIWLRRYGLLTKGNFDASIPNGAQALDVTGFFSTKNGILVEALAVLAATVAIAARANLAGRALTGRTRNGDWPRRLAPAMLALVLLPGLVVDAAFQAGIALRNRTEITPNQPVVQYPYIKRHVDATNAAFGLDRVEVKEFRPHHGGDPKPDLQRILDSPTIRNAPLWPGYNSWLERLIDPEYKQRILQTGGNTTIYGPTLDTFHQQEKLRPYYDFMDVDTTRYVLGGQPRLFASSVRELPLVEPKPWLAWWGQRFVVFTHGHGLVMAPLNGHDRKGEPAYASRGIPTHAPKALKPANESVYYGEGSGSMAYSNVSSIEEHDQPTDEGRAQISFPEDVRAGIRLDSPLKRLVVGFKSRQFWDIAFSDLITSKTRVHYYRTPLERLEHVAPFLFYDTDPYAVNRGDGITWMVNGITTSNRYPYSGINELGDESDRRTPTPRPTKWVNYARDAVKATVDAYTGQVQLYKFADEPVINAWADVYPSLFKDRREMPPALRDQVQYPPQLFHLLFDDLYIYYHQRDALTYFAQEDVFDDGDEVVGPVLDEGRAITFSIEPYYWIAETGRDLPASTESNQFAMSMVFTPENALNLRAIATAYMDGDDYGRLSLLEVPKGAYYPGPEQADSAIDEDPFISQQLGLWTRRGLELIRGHTTPVILQGELFYIEPVFIRSLQNPLPRLERVIVVYRGKAFMQRRLSSALRAAIAPNPLFPIRPGPELGGEPAFDRSGHHIVGKRAGSGR